jgi:hypothetical protein
MMMISTKRKGALMLASSTTTRDAAVRTQYKGIRAKDEENGKGEEARKRVLRRKHSKEGLKEEASDAGRWSC